MLRQLKTILRDVLISTTFLSGYTVVRNRIDRLRHVPIVRILCFHKIGNLDLFKDKIAKLSLAYQWVSVSEIVNGSVSSEQLNICLTFDDGYKSWWQAVPYLERNRIPAVFFISSGFINCGDREEWENYCRSRLRLLNPEQNLSWKEVEELSRNPLFEIGGHTENHVSLGQIKDSNEIWREVKGDKEAIEKRIRKQINFFAYPFGDRSSYSDLSQSLIKRAGYNAALTLVPGANRRLKDPLLLNRDCLDDVNNAFLTRAWVEGGYDIWKSIQARLG